MASDLVALLKRGLQLEYRGLFLYRIHAAEIADPEVRQTFVRFGRMEQEHAALLGQKILESGGTISYSMKPLEEVQKPLLAVIEEHLAAEKQAIALYRKGIEISLDDEMVEFFARLVGDEEEHQRVLTGIQARIAGQ